MGGRIVKMDALRKHFDALGFSDVETFIASGNVIFRSRSTNPRALEEKIERHLRKALGFDVATLIRSTSELSAVARSRPFPDADTPGHSLYIGLLRTNPGEAEKMKVLAMRTPTDEFRVEGRELYWLCRTKSMDSIVSGARLEKTVGMPATFRNVTTIRKLADKYCK